LYEQQPLEEIKPVIKNDEIVFIKVYLTPTIIIYHKLYSTKISDEKRKEFKIAVIK